MRTTWILGSLALVYSFAAPPRTTPASGAVDPCTLLTAKEVSAALGIASLPGRPYLGSKKVCYFAADTGYVMGAPSVTLMVTTPSAFENGKLMGPHPVSGLGDEAYYVGGQSYVKLGVRKGNGAFSVTVVAGEHSTATAAQVEQIEEALARKVMARL
ncbi:MAG: hypothetical protein ACRENQ_12135 [Gemmatimonadaceae bacterium]